MRMHEVTAAMLLPQIPRLAVIHEIHVRNHALLRSIIGDHANIEILVASRRRATSTTPCSSTWWA